MTDDECTEAEYFLLDKLYVFKQDRKDSTYQTLDNIYKELHKAEELILLNTIFKQRTQQLAQR